MVKTNGGLDGIADLIASDITEMAVGTGTTPETKTDDSLESEQLAKSVSGERSGTGEATFVMTIGTAELNGLGLSELGTKDPDGNLQDRITHSGIDKTSSIEVEYRLTETARNPQ